MKVIFQRNTALKFILKQPAKQKERIIVAVMKLPEGDVIAMAGNGEHYRLRVGDYRVVFCYNDQRDTIIIRNIGNRGDVYKG